MKPKKSLGQNFLVDQNVIKKIVKSVDLHKKNILEIGPGTGNLTKEIILQNPKSFLGIEKDTSLSKLLKKKLNKNKQFKIINNDILKFDIENIIKDKTIVFGNLPYNISTKILVNLIKFKKWPPQYEYLILMFQKEVAQRIMSKKGTNNYGRLSIITKARLSVIDHFNISKNCFFPKPKIDSTVIIFKPIINQSVKFKNIETLEKITNIFFSNRRKMINKSLKKLLPENIIKKNLNDIDGKLRPQELTYVNFFEIAKYFEEIK